MGVWHAMIVKIFKMSGRHSSSQFVFNPPLAAVKDLVGIIEDKGSTIAQYLQNNPGDIDVTTGPCFMIGGRSSLSAAAAQMSPVKFTAPNGSIYGQYARGEYGGKTKCIVCVYSNPTFEHALPKLSRKWIRLDLGTPASLDPLDLVRQLVATDEKFGALVAKAAVGTFTK